MLFEQRCYTLKPGTLGSFWQAQVDRGFDLVQPIQQKLIGYFASVTGPVDQVTHLYRYDSLDDWRQRLHGLYGVAALEPYFRTVRALMTAQQNQFYVLAPVPEFTPLWGEGRDWSPDQRAPDWLDAGPNSLVEEHTTILLPGTMPSYWKAWRAYLDETAVTDRGSLLVSLVSLTGQLHKVVFYRQYPDMNVRDEGRARLQSCKGWRTLQDGLAPMVVSQEVRLMRPAPLAELSPLFYRS